MRHHLEWVPRSWHGVLRGGHRRNSALREEWYPRAVLFVADIDRTLDFYVNGLGFTEQWYFGDEGTPHVAEADRQGCALIFSTESPDKAGKGLLFISLNVDVPRDQIHAEIEALD